MRNSVLGLTLSCLAFTALLATFGCSDSGKAAKEASSDPSIEGSYQLVSRDLPDGSVLKPPEVFGFLTFTSGYRHFHIYTPGPDGQPFSISFVASYTLSPSEYTETRQYDVSNNATPGSGLAYTLTAAPAHSAVTLGDGTVTFSEIGGTPTLVFTSEGMTATAEGEFVDHWIKVE